MSQKLEKASNDLDYYKNRDDTHPLNQLYEPPVEDFYGPVATELRYCTDFLFTIIWIIFLLFSLAYGYYAFLEFKIERMYKSADFRNDLCGLYQFVDKPFTYYLDPDVLGDIAICVSKCPSDPDYTSKICLYDVDGSTILDDYCYDTYYTDQYLIYCMPMAITPRRSAIESIINTDMEIAKRIAGDFWINIEIIIGALAIQIVIGVIYVLILLGKRIAHIMVWTFVTGFCVAIYFLSHYLEVEKQRVIKRDCPEDIQDPYTCIPLHLYILDTVSVGLIVTIPVYVTSLIFCFHKILRMIQVMDNMIKPLRQLPHMLIVPFFVALIQAALGVIYMLVFIGGINSGTTQTVSAPAGFSSTEYRKIVFQVWQQRGFYVVTFFYFWTLQALYYFVRCYIACSSSVWYYSRDKNYLNAPILRPLWYTIRYHMGSFFLGGLLIPLFWMFNGPFYYWKSMLEQIPRKSFILSVLLFISIPGFWIYEHAGKYISHRNFIHIAIFGDSFWTTGQKVFYLRERNYSRVDMIRRTLGFIRIIGMLLISSGGSYLVYYTLFTNQLIDRFMIDVKQSVQFPIVPALFSFVTGLYLAQNFTSVIDIIAEVMMFDLVADEEMFMGQQRFADQDMLDFANKYSKEKSKKDFVVTNQGRINPMNDNADVNDLIKPINIKDLMDQDEEDEPEEIKPQQEEEPKSYDSDLDKQFDKNLKQINLDDMDNLDNQGGLDDEFKDDIDEYNKNRVQDVHIQKDLEEDVIVLDKNKVENEGNNKKTDRNRF